MKQLQVMIMALALAGCSMNVAEPGSRQAIGGKADGVEGGIDVLGRGTHSADAVDIVVVADSEDGLSTPSDVALNPSADELWITNRADSTITVIDAPGTDEAEASTYGGPGNLHFLARPSGIAFGGPSIFATIHMEHERTQPSTPADFMGPTLWTARRYIFDGGHQGHIDMQHNTPDGAGIAWWGGNAYFVFDGWHSSITYYDFNHDHGPGGSDHSDGTVLRFVEGEVGYVDGVPSHLEVDRESGKVYAADTGNDRIVVLDPTTGEVGDAIHPNYDGTQQYQITDADFRTVADGDEVGLERPSGLALHDGLLYVTDNATARVVALDLEGHPIDYLALEDHVEEGGLTGITFDADGRMYVVDSAGDQVLRIAPRPAE